jgi:hypothetical protein
MFKSFVILTFLSFAISINANEFELTDLVVPIYESIDVADYSKQICSHDGLKKTCIPTVSKLEKGTKIRILRRASAAYYKVEVFSDDGESQGIFHSSAKYVDKAINWSAVKHTLDILQSEPSAGAIQNVSCKYGVNLVKKMKNSSVSNDENLPQIYTRNQLTELVLRHSSSDDGSMFRPKARPDNLVTSNAPASSLRPVARPVINEVVKVHKGDYLPGCEVLKEGKFKDESRNKLKNCIQSMRTYIADGARNDDGSLNRDNLFKNMFNKLNPTEQAFAGKVFTSIGEVEILNNKADYMSIMKVLDNRAKFARKRSGNNSFNELDAALADWQFSMYNPSEPGWRKVLDPGKKIKSSTLDHVVDALVSLDNTDTSEYDNVYMYHANYVEPKDWDWDLLSDSMSMDFGEGNITKSEGSSFHHFYKPAKGNKGVYIGNYKKWRRNAN